MIKKGENIYLLSDSVYAFIFPSCEDLGNAGIITTKEGAVVIDTDVRSVDQLFATLPQITDKPVKFLINTHHAFDHTSANCIFARKGVTIIGSGKCREEMIRHGERNFKRWSDRKPDIKKILRVKDITVALPHITFDHELHLHLGEQTIELFYFGHGHTPGDIIIYLPTEQILFGGDLLWVGFFPNVREANVPNQIKILDRVLEFPVKHYIPGHGCITSDRNEIIVMRDYLRSLYETINKMLKDGKNIEEVKTLENDLVKAYPDWQGRQFITTGIEVIYQSLKNQGD